MWASELRFERYMSKPILFFAYLVCPFSFRVQIKVHKMRFCHLANLISVKGYRTISKQNLKNTEWSLKIARGEKIFRNKKFAEKFLFFTGKTSYCLDLRAIEQIPLDL